MIWMMVLLILLLLLIAAVTIFGIVLLLLLVRPSTKINYDLFEKLPAFQPDFTELPESQPYSARDGSSLSYRYYPSDSDRVMIFLHDNRDGRYLHTMARYIAGVGLAKVYLPDLRGFGVGPYHRGDVDYIGQIVDDLGDLIRIIKKKHPVRRLVVGGHGAGGGTAIKLASSEYGRQIDGVLLLSPQIGVGAPTERKHGNGGQINAISMPRYIGLKVLNMFRIRRFNKLTVMRVNKPDNRTSPTEMLEWSYRMLASRIPGSDYNRELKIYRRPMLILVSEQDEQFDPQPFKRIFNENKATVHILPGQLSHDSMLMSADTADQIDNWIRIVIR
jgi:non-heme chloroperoxidase